MHLFALRHQRIARERVRVLATDQHAQAPDLGRHHSQAPRVAIRPNELLVERRNQLAMMVEDRAVGADQHIRVPEAADAGLGPFRDPDRNDHAVRTRRHADFGQLRSIEAHGLRRERP